MKNLKLAVKSISLEQAAKMKLDTLVFNLSMRLSDFATLNGLPDQGVASLLHSRLHDKAKALLVKNLTADEITIQSEKAVLKGNRIEIHQTLKRNLGAPTSEHIYALKEAQTRLELAHGKKMGIYSDAIVGLTPVKSAPKKVGNSKGVKMPPKSAPAPAPAPIVNA